MTTLTSIDLQNVTGGKQTGFVSPCMLSDKMTLEQLKKTPDKGKDALELQMAQCGLGRVSQKGINAKKHILFATPPVTAE